MKNRDAKIQPKRNEKQIQTAGKFPYHRVEKLIKRDENIMQDKFKKIK